MSGNTRGPSPPLAVGKKGPGVFPSALSPSHPKATPFPPTFVLRDPGVIEEVLGKMHHLAVRGPPGWENLFF